jgi:DNA-binding GntR family transcriptional regulator
LQFQTKEDHVANFLREGIISGRFPRGSRLKQEEIAIMLGTSITPVREALKLLDAEGYVVGASHRGAVVSPFNVNSAQEILDLRILLEGRLLLACMANLTAAKLDELSVLQTAFDEAAARNDRDTVRSINYRFHEQIYTAADLPETLALLRPLWARYPFDLVNKVEGRIKRAALEHRVLLEALISRDSVSALVALTEHIKSGWNEFKSTLSVPEV